MANFDWSMKYLLQNEGEKYTDLPADAGGPTKFGITLGTLRDWQQGPTISWDVEHLSLDEATAIYRAKYWTPLMLDQVISPGAATAIFDTAVNQGLERATLLTQAAVKVTPDGKMGPATIKGINGVFSIVFLRELIPLVQNRYIDIVVADPTQVKFLRGWLARSQRLLTLMG